MKKNLVELRNKPADPYSLTLFMTKKSIVLVGGCFDILHYGHIYFLNEAKKLGHYLIVALEPDSRIKKLKGIDRPIHNEQIRKEMLLSLKAVDEVIVLPEFTSNEDYYEFVEKIKPTIIAITENDLLTVIKKDQAKKVNAKLKIVPKIKNLSSSSIIEALNKDNF